MNKGDYGYMNYYKKRHLIGVIIYAVLILIFVIMGKCASENIAIAAYMIAIILVLPGAKQLIAVLTVFSYHTINEQLIEDLDEHTCLLEGGISIYDVTLASNENIAYVPYIYLFGDKLYCLVNITSKITSDYVKGYLEKILKNSGIELTVIAVHNISEMNRILENLEDNEKSDMNLLNNAKKQILVYNV